MPDRNSEPFITADDLRAALAQQGAPRRRAALLSEPPGEWDWDPGLSDAERAELAQLRDTVAHPREQRDELRRARDTATTPAQALRDARSALEMLQTSRPDVAILDIGLPDMDGRKLARAIRTQYGDAVALIALTGYGQEQDRDATLDAGFRDHLTKPLSSDALIAALQRVFEDDLNGA